MRRGVLMGVPGVCALLSTSPGVCDEGFRGYLRAEGGVAFAVPSEGTAVAFGGRFATGIGHSIIPVTFGVGGQR